MKKEFQKQIQQFEEALRLRQSFDLVVKPLCVQGINMRLYFVDGFAKDEIFKMPKELRESVLLTIKDYVEEKETEMRGI